MPSNDDAPAGAFFSSAAENPPQDAGQPPARKWVPFATQLRGRTLTRTAGDMPLEVVTEWEGHTLHWVPVPGVGERGRRA